MLGHEESIAEPEEVRSEAAAHRIVMGLKKAKVRRLERRQDLTSRKALGEGATEAPGVETAAKSGTRWREKSLYDLIPPENCSDFDQLNCRYRQNSGNVRNKHKVGTSFYFNLKPHSSQIRFFIG